MKQQRSSKRDNMIKKVVTSLVLLSLFTQIQAKIEYSFTRLKAHPNINKEIAADSAGLDTGIFEFFIGAWVKASQEGGILVVKDKVGYAEFKERALMALTDKHCQEVQKGSWLFVVQNFKKASVGFYSTSYFRNNRGTNNECSKSDKNLPYVHDCAPCDQNHIAHIFGDSLKFESNSFKITQPSSVETMIGLVSGFVRLPQDTAGRSYYPNEIATVIMSAHAKELTHERIYLGNFHYQAQKDMFIDKPSDGTPETKEIIIGGVYKNIDEFHSKFSKKGFIFQHNVNHILKKEVNLFGDGSVSLAKTFCFRTQWIGLIPQKLKIGTLLKIVIGFGLGNQNSLFAMIRLSVTDIAVDDKKVFIKIHAFVSSDLKLGIKPPDYLGLSDSIELPLSSKKRELKGGICLKFTPTDYNGGTQDFFVSVACRFFDNSGVRGQTIRFGGFDRSKKIFYRFDDPTKKNASISLRWRCEKMDGCLDLVFNMNYYREFVGGYTNYYLEESQLEGDRERRLSGMKDLGFCLIEIMGEQRPTCVYCLWGLLVIDGKCAKKSIETIKNCRNVQENDHKLCQECSCVGCGKKFFDQAIGYPNCVDSMGCQGPKFNRYHEYRCDYCGNKPPNHCRCNRYQKQVGYPGDQKKKTCQCRLNNCKNFVPIYLLFVFR